MSIRVCLEAKYSLILEALRRHKCGDYILDFQERRISNTCLRSFDLKTKAHASTNLHSLKEVIEGERALSDEICNILILLLELFEFHTLSGILDSLIKFCIEFLVLKSALI